MTIRLANNTHVSLSAFNVYWCTLHVLPFRKLWRMIHRIGTDNVFCYQAFAPIFVVKILKEAPFRLIPCLLYDFTDRARKSCILSLDDKVYF